MIKLSATTWNHVRGVAPLAAAAQVFSDRNPDVHISVAPHSAQQFGEGPLEPLARDFDLVVFDHPLTGAAAEEGLFLPLDAHLSAEVLKDRRDHSVGLSFQSYVYADRVWGLPLDAACMVAASRPDLLDRIPGTWDALLALAEEGSVMQGFSRMTTTAMFYMLRNQGFDESSTIEALQQLYRAAGGRPSLKQGSMQLLEAAAGGDAIAFIPACYGYSNYCRPGFARSRLRFHPSPLAPSKGSVIGGAGIAVSTHSKHPEAALRFLEWVTGAECQSYVYAVCGGQPAHAAAWAADLPNALTGDFYRTLRPAMDRGWLRPNTPDFHHEQSELATRLQREVPVP
jgi:multiple sugar transport system substrate-binding protein